MEDLIDLEGRPRPYRFRIEGRPSIDLSSKLSPTYGGNNNHYKNVQRPLSILPVGIWSTLAVFPNKSVSSSFK